MKHVIFLVVLLVLTSGCTSTGAPVDPSTNDAMGELTIDNFKNEFAAAVDHFSIEGNVGEVTIHVPAGFDELCLVNHANPKIDAPDKLLKHLEKSDNNVYLFSSATPGLLESFKTGPIKIGFAYEGMTRCFPVVENKIAFQFSAKSDSTELSWLSQP